MAMAKRNPNVDKYLHRAKNWQPEMEKLRAILLTCPLQEDFKWGKPCYTHGGDNVVMILALKGYCALSFLKGALLQDTADMLVAPGENSQAARQLRFTSVAEIDRDTTQIIAYITDAIRVEEAGLEIDFKEKTELALPKELKDRLQENPALRTAFEGLTPGRQRAYVLYFSHPKHAATRAAHVEKYLPQILAGKGMND